MSSAPPDGAPSAVPSFQHFQRDYAVVAVKLSRDNKHSDTNSDTIVRAICRANSAIAAEWAQQQVSDSPDWLLKLSKRNDTIRKNKGKGAVILSFGEGYDTLVLLGESTKAPAHSKDVPRICVCLSVATAESEEDEDRMEAYGFVRPSDGLFEHVTAGIEAAMSEQNLRVFLHTDLAKWYPSSRKAEDEDTRKTAFRLCTSGSQITLVDKLEWGDVFSADPTPAAAKKPKPKQARKTSSTTAAADTGSQEKATPTPAAESRSLEKPPSTTTAAAAAAPKPAAGKKASSGKAAADVSKSKKVTSSKSSFDEGWSTGEDEETKGVKAIGYAGFRPREFMLLSKAFRGETITDEESRQNMAQSTTREKKIAERIVKKANKELLSIKETQKMDTLLKAASAIDAKETAAKDKEDEEEEEVAALDSKDDDEQDDDDNKKKSRGRPKGSKNKSKEEDAPKKEKKSSSKKSKKGTKEAEEKKESEGEEEKGTSKKKRKRSSSKSHHKSKEKRSKK